MMAAFREYLAWQRIEQREPTLPTNEELPPLAFFVSHRDESRFVAADSDEPQLRA